MKINQGLYQAANECTPAEVQQMEGRKVEIFFMDEVDGVFDTYVKGKGQFAVWASEDAVNYRLFIERGYYEEVKELYAQPINEIWMKFWDTTDSIQKKFSKFCIYPLMGFAIALLILSFILQSYIEGNLVSYISIGVLLVMFVAMLIANSKVKSKFRVEQAKSRQEILDHFGEKEFDAIIEKQKSYMDKFMDNLYPQTDDGKIEEESPVEAKEEEASVEEKEAEVEAVATEEATKEE